jgi:protein TonB
MFENLIESKRKKQKSLAQSITSVIIHIIVIFAAVKATSGAAETLQRVIEDTTMVFLEPPKAPEPPPEQPPPEAVVAANPPPQGFQVVTPPADIPTEIPPVNLNEKFDPRDFTGKGVEGGIGTGVVGGTGPVLEGEVFLAAEVDETPAALNEGGICNPKFPPVMQSAGIPGRVVMQFVVNTDGKVDAGSLKVMNSTHKAFEDPAKEALMKCPFKPGRSRGQPVRVLVQQAISFKLGQ